MSLQFNVQFGNWVNDFKKQSKLSKTDAKTVIIKSAQLLYKQIVEYTPVGDPTLWKWPAHADYVPGQLKASWKISDTIDKITISNNQPYAERVEYGWSTQAPEGMLRRSIKAYPDMLQKSLSEYKKL